MCDSTRYAAASSSRAMPTRISMPMSTSILVADWLSIRSTRLHTMRSLAPTSLHSSKRMLYSVPAHDLARSLPDRSSTSASNSMASNSSSVASCTCATYSSVPSAAPPSRKPSKEELPASRSSAASPAAATAKWCSWRLWSTATRWGSVRTPRESPFSKACTASERDSGNTTSSSSISMSTMRSISLSVARPGACPSPPCAWSRSRPVPLASPSSSSSTL
mmetsp:Transcript_30209/g.58018  ORF Transcript_30209/g.58018 Transcript_30209/m.58018 type:complete len:220 (+) Transcript_30209:1849-2508(+)